MLLPSRSPRSSRASRSGFTLLEILVVLAIIGMLMGVLLKQVDGSLGSGQASAAKIFVQSSVKTSLIRYRIDLGDFPSTAEGLEAMVTAPASKADKWKGPYIDGGKLPLDPWSEPYIYRNPGTRNKTGYDILSKGPDQTEGTPDDIGNWE